MIEKFSWIGKELFESGLVYSHGGDMSVREGDRIFITRKDAMLHRLEEGDIIELPLSDVSEKDKDASRELVVHRALYKGTGTSAIIHAHPPCAVAVSITDNKVVPADAEGTLLLRSVPIVRAGDPVGSGDVARIIPTLILKDGGVAMIKGHGSFAIGASLEEAYKFTSALEHSCKILISLRSTTQARREQQEMRPPAPHHRGAIPPGIGVMDRSRFRKRNIENR